MRKLMWFSIGFAVAIFAGIYALSAPLCLIAAGIGAMLLAVCLMLLLRLPKLRIAAMVLLGCSIGFAWQAALDQFYLSPVRQTDATSGKHTIYATDYSQPTDFGISVEGVVKLDGKLYRVMAYMPNTKQLQPGDQVTGDFSMGSTLSDGSRDSRGYRSDGIFCIAYTNRTVDIERTTTLPLYCYPAYVAGYLSTLIRDAFPEDTYAFAKALLLGDTSDLSYETDTAFKISGIRHVIAVSGLHVSILFSVLYILTGKRSFLAALIGIPVLIFFAAVAGFTPSIIRACIMHGLMALAMLFRREYDPPTALSFAALIMLAVNPWVAASVGFQLSCGCMIGIFLCAEPIKGWLMDEKRLGRWKGKRRSLASFVATSVSVSIGATVITTPLCANSFGMVSLVSVLTNLLTLWVVTIIFYGILLTCLAGMLFAPLGVVFGWIVAWPIRYVLFIAMLLAKIPFAAVYADSIFVVIWLVITYLLLAAFLIFKGKRLYLYACGSGIVLCMALVLSWWLPTRDECRVTVLDVGQGQCILLQSEGKNYLVDCGGDSSAYAADQAAGLLASQGIFKLDGLILTHYDTDHAAGAILLLSRVKVDTIYLPDCVDPNGYSAVFSAYESGNVEWVTDQSTISWGDMTISMYASQKGKTDNESGLCVLFQTENCDILITGDRSIAGEQELLSKVSLPELELLVVGHHGSRYSTGQALLDQTKPQTAIISVSAYNPYGHPADQVLARLEACGCVIYRTDRDGTVIFRR